MRPDFRLTSAILRVGEGRGFVVKRRMHEDCIVITAAHCLPVLPPPHPGAYLEELTYQRLLGPLGTEPTVWTELLFTDPVSDIAVLGAPDGQDLYEQADDYKALMASARPLAIAEAPVQHDDKAAEGEARVLSLDGHWREGRVQIRDGREQLLPSKGRIQMSKTNYLQTVISDLQRTAGPYRCANSRHCSETLRCGARFRGSNGSVGPCLSGDAGRINREKLKRTLERTRQRFAAAGR